MATILRMPSLSPTMESGVISAWRKQEGDFVEVGEILAEIETDKAVMDYEMADEGYVRILLAEAGQEVAVGMPIAILSETKDEDIAEVLEQAKAAAASPAPAGEPPATAPEATVPAQAAQDTAQAAPTAAAGVPAAAGAVAAAPSPPPPPPPPLPPAAAPSQAGAPSQAE